MGEQPMKPTSPKDQLDDRAQRELAALADGSLPERRRAAAQAHVDSSPELTALLAEQRRALEAIRTADVSAPAGLRARVEAQRRALEPRTRRRRLAIGGSLATACAAVALTLALALPGDVPGGPTIVSAAQFAQRSAQLPPPGQDARAPKLLEASVDGVRYPYWRDRFGWHAAGARTDLLHGRRVRTVFYTKGARRIGYAIIPGSRLFPPAATSQRHIDGTLLVSFSAEGRKIVTWTRGGHTCVLSGRGVGIQTLYTLAAWKGKGAVAF
jgi:hypothetical protein